MGSTNHLSIQAEEPLRTADGRTREAKRFRAFVADITSECGGPEALSRADHATVRNIAAMLLRAEQIETAILKGQSVDGDQLVRLSNAAHRLLASLRKRAKPVQRAMGLKEYLAGRTANT